MTKHRELAEREKDNEKDREAVNERDSRPCCRKRLRRQKESRVGKIEQNERES